MDLEEMELEESYGRTKKKLSKLELIIAAYILEHPLSTVEDISEKYCMNCKDNRMRVYINSQVIRNTIRHLREKGIVKCVRYSVLERILKENEINELLNLMNKRRIKSGELVCFANIDKETFEREYVSEHNISLNYLLENLDTFLGYGTIISEETIEVVKKIRQILNKEEDKEDK